MAIGSFGNLFNYLDSLGVMDVILPFTIIFAIVWAILTKIQVFGKEQNSKISLILSIAIALLSIFPHVTGRYQQFDIVNFINNAFPQVGLIIIAAVMLFIILGLFGGSQGFNSIIFTIAALVSVVFLVIIFWTALFPGQQPTWLNFLSDPDLQALIIIIAVFGLIVRFVTHEPQKDKKTTGIEDFFNGMQTVGKKMFGKEDEKK